MRVGLFTPGKAFEVVVKEKISQLKGPCMKLIELVVDEIRQIATVSLAKVTRPFSSLVSQSIFMI